MDEINPEVAATPAVEAEAPAVHHAAAPVAEEAVEVPTKFKKIVEEIEKMTVLDLSELVKVFEKKFGVSASAVAVAGPAAAAGAEEEGKSTNDVELTEVGATKIAVIKVVKEALALGLKEAKDLVDTFFEEIRLALEKGDSVKLSGFGNFQLREKPQRPGRNPKTGEEIPISARRVVTFHASQKLKSLVEQHYAGNAG